MKVDSAVLLLAQINTPPNLLYYMCVCNLTGEFTGLIKDGETGERHLVLLCYYASIAMLLC